MADRPDSTTTTEAASACPQCGAPRTGGVCCASCGALFEPGDCDDFALLGLPAHYDLDPALLRQRYLELARLTHPDRLVGADEDQRLLALRVSARLNDAYRRLNDPLQRAEYLLQLAGGDSGADDRTVPQEVLAETLLWREEIDEAREAGNTQTLAALRQQIGQRYAALQEQIAALAARLPGDEALRKQLREKLNCVRYYQRMLEQVQGA